MSTKIEWTKQRKSDGSVTNGDTWNPILGCDKVSAGCKNCYAIKTAWIRQHNPKMADRFGGLVSKSENGQLNWTGKINLVTEALIKPLRTKKPTTYFVNSMSDLFHDEVPFWYIDIIFKIMHVCPQHTFQILTKRPRRMWEYFSQKDLCEYIDDAHLRLAAEYDIQIPSMVCLQQQNGPEGWPLPNVWIGVSVENQETANERIQYLNMIPAAVKFLSCEPLLGPVDFEKAIGDSLKWHAGGLKNCISWVIAGGESGPGARPMHPDWVRSIRDQCKEAGVPFFFKQWGEWYTRWVDITDKSDHPYVFKYFESYEQWTQKYWVRKGDACISIDGTWCKTGGDLQRCEYPVAIMNKVGKAKSGRLLDGQLHDEYPVTN